MLGRFSARNFIGISMMIGWATLSSAKDSAPRKPDLADAVAGTYAGEVISDSKGSSKSDLTLTVARTGPNAIEVTSDRHFRSSPSG